MALDFPASPTTGQIYTDANGRQWVFNGTSWGGAERTAYWDRTGTTLNPKTAGDTVFTSGSVKVGGTSAAPNIEVKADGSIVANTNGLVYDAANKRLGVGSSSLGGFMPDGNQLVVGSGIGNQGITIYSGNASSGAIYFADGTTAAQRYAGYLAYEHTANELSFGANEQERCRITSAGGILIGTSANVGGALLQVNGDRIRVIGAKTPTSATAAGFGGEICWDQNYIYVCVANNQWKRSALSTW